MNSNTDCLFDKYFDYKAYVMGIPAVQNPPPLHPISPTAATPSSASSSQSPNSPTPDTSSQAATTPTSALEVPERTAELSGGSGCVPEHTPSSPIPSTSSASRTGPSPSHTHSQLPSCPVPSRQKRWKAAPRSASTPQATTDHPYPYHPHASTSSLATAPAPSAESSTSAAPDTSTSNKENISLRHEESAGASSASERNGFSILLDLEARLNNFNMAHHLYSKNPGEVPCQWGLAPGQLPDHNISMLAGKALDHLKRVHGLDTPLLMCQFPSCPSTGALASASLGRHFEGPHLHNKAVCKLCGGGQHARDGGDRNIEHFKSHCLFTAAGSEEALRDKLRHIIKPLLPRGRSVFDYIPASGPPLASSSSSNHPVAASSNLPLASSSSSSIPRSSGGNKRKLDDFSSATSSPTKRRRLHKD